MYSWTKAFAGALALATGVLASPAMATDFTVVFTGNDKTSGSTTFRDFSATSSGQTLNVRASGWSFIGSTVTNAYIGRYAQGLGITNDGESGADNSHVIDNSGNKDFVLLQFSEPVLLKSLKTAAFPVDGSTDSDASIAWGKNSGAWNSTLDLDNKSSSVLNALLSTTPIEVKNTASNGKITVGSASNLWLVAASLTNTDGFIDGFKLTNVTVSTAPEPGTWMMMILGFGAVGVSVRRRRMQPVSPTAA